MMPKFVLPAEPDSYDPVYSPPDEAVPIGRKPTPGEARADYARKTEELAASIPVVGGVAKPLMQFVNTLSSPDTKMGIITGPINGISKLTNALGDLIQEKPIDASDAWTISDENARKYSPFRLLTGAGQEVTPSDQAGLELGEGIGAEIAGAYTGATLINGARRIRRLQQLAQGLQQTQGVRRAAVAISASPKLTAATNVTRNVGTALGTTALATAFLDAEDGNLADLTEAFGLPGLPGNVQESDDYLEAFRKSIGVEGIAAPLALAGMGAFVGPIRRGMAGGDLGWISELANAELAPYVPQPLTNPALPPAGLGGAPQLPGYTQQGGALVPYDSAITRSLQEQTQIRQVIEQRQRLQDMGLIQQGEAGQLEFSISAGVDPEIKLQIRELQMQRGRLIKQATESGQDVGEQLGQIDEQIGDLIQSGQASDFMPGERFSQPELDLPDGRPEIDTYLANLDELSDGDLRQIHSRVVRETSDARRAEELQATQGRIEAAQAEIENIGQRREAGEITDTGAKRLLTKARKELEQAQEALTGIQQRERVPEALVGDQLQLRLDQQLNLDLADAPEMQPTWITGPAVDGMPYRTPDQYRNVLEGFSRDVLRNMVKPSETATGWADVAALVKARTGRRIWSAKKSDIIDALVEVAQRRRQFLGLGPDAQQMEAVLRANPLGGDAPLFDQPADLSVPNMQTILDADGKEVLVPVDSYSPRGMDSETRTRLKAEILERAIRNGEVQPPSTPLPDRPATEFNQGSLIADLMSDETGQMSIAYANDDIPTYKASGKGLDTLIEEMRLRFEYQALDGKAQQAARDAYMAEQGWDLLPWEEKKKFGMLTEGFYSLRPYTVENPLPPNPLGQANPARSDLSAKQVQAMDKAAGDARLAAGVEPPRQPKVYRMQWQNGNAVSVEDAAMPKVTPEQAKANAKAQKAAARAAKAEAAGGLKDIQARKQALLKRREELLRQSQGANC